MMAERTIQDAARVLMAHSPWAASTLGPRMGGSPIFQQLYDRVASQMLGDTQSGLTDAERELVAQFITGGDEDDTRSFMLRVRLTNAEHAELVRMTDEAGFRERELSEYVRRRLFGA